MAQSKTFSWPLMINNVEREDLDVLIDYLKQDDPKLTHGPKVREFEEAWSKWLGVKYSVMLNSGSSANDLTMLALKYLVGEGEVIVPPLTWVSDISSVIRAGFKPIFIDIEMNSLAIDYRKLKSKINSNTKAIFLTHILGLNGLNHEIIEIAKEHDIPIIEDVCESHGASFENQKCGSIGWASNFSFYYAHHMTTIEGGIVSTNDEKLYELIRMLRSHGLVREISNPELKKAEQQNNPDLNPEFIFKYAAHNMRPTELQGLLGLSQLKRLESNNMKRTRNFSYFLEKLDSNKYHTDLKLEGSSNYALIVISKSEKRKVSEKIELELKNSGIEFRRGLSGGGNQLRQPFIKEYIDDIDLSQFPNVEHIHFHSWYIGNYPELDLKQIDLLLDILNKI
jgi:CDP-6-deoxy-D-xylo-4-hexulose-3-dehydrase